jgi:hypothetical protein
MTSAASVSHKRTIVKYAHHHGGCELASYCLTVRSGRQAESLHQLAETRLGAPRIKCRRDVEMC